MMGVKCVLCKCVYMIMSYVYVTQFAKKGLIAGKWLATAFGFLL